MKVEDIKLAFETNVKFGLVQDINLDLNTVQKSLDSVKPILSQGVSVLNKNLSVLDTIEKAIQRVEATAKEIGADSIVKELEKPKAMLKDFRTKTNNSLKPLQSAVNSL